MLKVWETRIAGTNMTIDDKILRQFTEGELDNGILKIKISDIKVAIHPPQESIVIDQSGNLCIEFTKAKMNFRFNHVQNPQANATMSGRWTLRAFDGINTAKCEVNYNVGDNLAAQI